MPVKSFDEIFYGIWRWIADVSVVMIAGFAWQSQEYWSAHWFSKWGIMLMLVSLSIGTRFGRIHWALIAPVAISLTSAIGQIIYIPMNFSWRGMIFSSFARTEHVEIVAQGAYTGLAFMVLITYAVSSKKDELKALADGFGILCVTTSLVIIWQTIAGNPYMGRGAFIGNPSMAASLIAVTYPFFAFRRRWRSHYLPLLTIPLIAIFCAHASIPVGILAVVLCVYFYNTLHLVLAEKIALFGTLLTGLLCIGLVMKGLLLFENDGRFYMYRIAWNHWSHAALSTKLFGYGNGSMGYNFPFWQVQAGQVPGQRWYDYFMWIHSDWLQTLVEQGMLGFAAYLNLFVFACIEANKKSAWLLSAVAGYGAMSIFNFPCHLPVHALVGVSLAAMAFRGDRRG